MSDTPVAAPVAPGQPRRSFLARVVGVMAAWPLLDRRSIRFARGSAEGVQSQPNAAILLALGAAILPSELAADSRTLAVTNFQRWMEGYRPGGEVSHGYGTGRIEQLPADPRPKWQSQLTALDTEAQRVGGQPFAKLSVEQRQSIVRGALAGERGDSLPSPLAAGHVALALLAHFYDSAAANDLCYESQIGRQQCRPLAAQAQRPVALARRS